MTCYDIGIKTGNNKNSGTDCKVELKIVGSKNETSFHDLSKPFHNDFERGNIDEFVINDVDIGDMNGGDQLNQVSNLVTMSVGGEKPPEFKDLEDENAGVDVLPLCCWHCNRAFADLEELKTHVKTHKGERFKSKRHKCQKCKKVRNQISATL